MHLAFLGAGKMATAIACGLIQHKVFSPEEMSAVDTFATACDAFTRKTSIRCSPDARACLERADVVLLAIKPQDVGGALPELKEQLRGKLLVSIAAGLSIERLSAFTGSQRIIRVMPNTPAMVSRGASVYACGSEATAADRELAGRIFGAIGIAFELPEEKLDAVTGVSGSGPAYVFEFIQALTEGAVAQGLPREVALDLIVQTVAGAAEMLLQKQGTPDELRTAVTSKGGTTAAGLEVLRDGGFRELIGRVVERATERSRELGRGQ